MVLVPLFLQSCTVVQDMKGCLGLFQTGPTLALEECLITMRALEVVQSVGVEVFSMAVQRLASPMIR